MQDDAIRQRIQTLYPQADVTIHGSDCSFEIAIVSPSFEGMSPLARQRSIMKLFQPELRDGTWHALTVKTRTPRES